MLPRRESAGTGSRLRRIGDKCNSRCRNVSASKPFEMISRTESAPTSNPRLSSPTTSTSVDWEIFRRQENRILHRMIGIGAARFLHDVIVAIHDVMPRAAVPVIVAREVKNTAALPHRATTLKSFASDKESDWRPRLHCGRADRRCCACKPAHRSVAAAICPIADKRRGPRGPTEDFRPIDLLRQKQTTHKNAIACSSIERPEKGSSRFF